MMKSTRAIGLLVWALVVIALSASSPGSGRALADARTGAQAAIGANRRTVETLEAVADTYVYQATPRTNYGGAPDMWVGEDATTQDFISLVEFDLSDIPVRSVIHRATFEAYLLTGGTADGTVDVDRVTDDWHPGTVTWNRRPTTDAGWGSASVGTAVNRFYSWDVTALVDAWVNGGLASQGMALHGTFSPPKSFETRDRANHPPRLVIDYTPPLPTFRLWEGPVVRGVSLVEFEAIDGQVFVGSGRRGRRDVVVIAQDDRIYEGPIARLSNVLFSIQGRRMWQGRNTWGLQNVLFTLSEDDRIYAGPSPHGLSSALYTIRGNQVYEGPAPIRDNVLYTADVDLERSTILTKLLLPILIEGRF